MASSGSWVPLEQESTVPRDPPYRIPLERARIARRPLQLHVARNGVRAPPARGDTHEVPAYSPGTVTRPADPAPTTTSTTSTRAARWLPRLAVTSALAAYVLIVFGSHVRVTDSGMGCPDWPLCDGSAGPLHDFHALMEQTHRYLAAVVTVLVVSTAVLAVRSRLRLAAVRPALVTVAVIVVQIGLGAVTVLAGNGAPTVAAHLLTGLALLGSTTVTAACTLAPRLPAAGPRLARVAWVATSAAAVLFVSGSLVVNAEAEKACAAFPLCPPDQPGGLVSLHLVHRSIAVLAGIALLTFAVHAYRTWGSVRGARPWAVALGTLVGVTACLGIVSALLQAPPGWQDLHLAGAAAVLASSVALASLGWLAGADSPTGPPAAERSVPERLGSSSGA